MDFHRVALLIAVESDGRKTPVGPRLQKAIATVRTFLSAKGLLQSVGPSGEDAKPPTALPALQAHDRQAWLLWKLGGKDQTEVARLLNAEHGTNLEQGQVSKMCGRFQKYIDAGGIARDLPKPAQRARVVDPARTELGARTDKRTPRPSDLARSDDDE